MEIKILKIRDHSTENERIFIRAVKDCNLSDFLVYDETFDEEGNPSNIWPHMHRLPNLIVKKGEYVSLRTQGEKGDIKKGKTDRGSTCHYIYWGFEHSILNNDGDTIHLIKIEDEQKKSIKVKK